MISCKMYTSVKNNAIAAMLALRVIRSYHNIYVNSYKLEKMCYTFWKPLPSDNLVQINVQKITGRRKQDVSSSFSELCSTVQTNPG